MMLYIMVLDQQFDLLYNTTMKTATTKPTVIDSKNFRLSYHRWEKRLFDPTNGQDLRVYQDFLLHNRWINGCPFVVEWPFLNVIDMIKHKIIEKHISGLISKSKK
jgi:hypothetical protein